MISIFDLEKLRGLLRDFYEIRRMSRPTAPSFAARCKVMKPACAVIAMPVKRPQKCTAPTFTAVMPA